VLTQLAALVMSAVLRQLAALAAIWGAVARAQRLANRRVVLPANLPVVQAAAEELVGKRRS